MQVYRGPGRIRSAVVFPVRALNGQDYEILTARFNLGANFGYRAGCDESANDPSYYMVRDPLRMALLFTAAAMFFVAHGATFTRAGRTISWGWAMMGIFCCSSWPRNIWSAASVSLLARVELLNYWGRPLKR
jgi:hypothetical protein